MSATKIKPTTRKPRVEAKPAAPAVKSAKKSRQSLTPEEREARIEALKEELDSAVTTVMNSPEQWVEFLGTVSDFAAKYSYRNQLLIWSQCRQRGFNPTMVLPAGDLDAKRFGRTPKYGWAGLGRAPSKGEKGLRIWRPVFRRYTEADVAKLRAAGGGEAALAARLEAKRATDPKGRYPERLVTWAIEHVFDISQTYGADVELPRTVTVRKQVKVNGTLPVLLTGEDVTGSLNEVIDLIQEQGYEYRRVPATNLGSANGETSRNGSQQLVRVRDDVDDAQAMKTTVHELAHILCGHLDDDHDYQGHRGQDETEAESVAYIVCGALGLDTGAYSAPYVAHWANGDTKVVEEATKKIISVAKTLLSELIPAESEAA